MERESVIVESQLRKKDIYLATFRLSRRLLIGMVIAAIASTVVFLAVFLADYYLDSEDGWQLTAHLFTAACTTILGTAIYSLLATVHAALKTAFVLRTDPMRLAPTRLEYTDGILRICIRGTTEDVFRAEDVFKRFEDKHYLILEPAPHREIILRKTPANALALTEITKYMTRAKYDRYRRSL